jgi:hypothetical protein
MLVSAAGGAWYAMLEYKAKEARKAAAASSAAVAAEGPADAELGGALLAPAEAARLEAAQAARDLLAAGHAGNSPRASTAMSLSAPRHR